VKIGENAERAFCALISLENCLFRPENEIGERAKPFVSDVRIWPKGVRFEPGDSEKVSVIPLAIGPNLSKLGTRQRRDAPDTTTRPQRCLKPRHLCCPRVESCFAGPFSVSNSHLFALHFLELNSGCGGADATVLLCTGRTFAYWAIKFQCPPYSARLFTQDNSAICNYIHTYNLPRSTRQFNPINSAGAACIYPRAPINSAIYPDQLGLFYPDQLG
jgi:hypothetical protein